MSSRREAKRARRSLILEKRERQFENLMRERREQQERFNEMVKKYMESEEFKRQEEKIMAENSVDTPEVSEGTSEDLTETSDAPLTEVEVV